MFSLFTNPNLGKPPFINRKLFQILSDIFHQKSFEDIRREGSKLRTYALLKTEIGFENDIFEIKNPIKRILMTKFRLSNHRLMIEKGRHINLPKAMRFCPFCHREVETDMHFLLVCPTSHALRSKPSFEYYTIEFKFIYLL